jgi:hypothetical protein
MVFTKLKKTILLSYIALTNSSPFPLKWRGSHSAISLAEALIRVNAIFHVIVNLFLGYLPFLPY